MAEPSIVHIQNFIDGQFVDSSASPRIDSFNPATGRVHLTMPNSTEADVNAAVAAAKRAFRGWAATPRQTRSNILYAIANAIEARLDEFAEAESRDQGKPVWLAKSVDIPRAVHNFRFFAGVALHQVDHSTVNDTLGAVNYTTRSPVGVAGLISPWNLPLYLLTWKIAPALVYGNTVVAKPSEITSFTAYLLAKVLNDCGVPPGVCNIVFGYGYTAGAALVAHPDVPMISFTGGTVTARAIIQASAPHYKKLSLELGGKNPGIVFDDADMSKCVAGIVRSSFTNQGEICLCTSRIYVQESIFETFLQRLVEETRKTITIGNPSHPGTTMGPLVSREHYNKVISYVAFAKEDGARILCGETVDPAIRDSLPAELQDGYFMRPTIVANLPESSRCIQEEIFGPVIVVNSFKDEADVIERSNGVKYGLAASIWTENVGRMHRVAHAIDAGTVWGNCWMVRDLNMPFGGMKQSGIGREGGQDSIEFFTEAKTICVKM